MKTTLEFEAVGDKKNKNNLCVHTTIKWVCTVSMSKAVKPGEDINENDRLIFCCRHPFFKIYTQN